MKSNQMNAILVLIEMSIGLLHQAYLCDLFSTLSFSCFPGMNESPSQIQGFLWANMKSFITFASTHHPFFNFIFIGSCFHQVLFFKIIFKLCYKSS